jgi:hypothetical protein
MQRIQVVFLLFIVLTIAIGNSVTFFAQRAMVRNQVKKSLKAQKLKSAQTFRFSKAEYNELQKFENNKEFLMNGGMYDIVALKTVQDSVLLLAFYDHKETSLLEKFLGFFKEQNSDQPASKSIAFKFSFSDFIDAKFLFQTLLNYQFFNLHLKNTEELSAFCTLQSPPPDYLV